MTQIHPLAKELAEGNGIDWRRLSGTGEGGMVLEADVIRYLTAVMTGDAEPPQEPVDPPPPDWDGTLSGLPQAQMEQAGIDSDIAAFVNERSSAQRDDVRPVPAPAAELPAPPPPARSGVGGLLSQIYAPRDGASVVRPPGEVTPTLLGPAVDRPAPIPVTPVPVSGIWTVPKLGQGPVRPEVQLADIASPLTAEEFELEEDQGGELAPINAAETVRETLDSTEVSAAEPAAVPDTAERPQAVLEESGPPPEVPSSGAAFHPTLALTALSSQIRRTSLDSAALTAFQDQVGAVLTAPVTLIQWISLSVQAHLSAGDQFRSSAVYQHGVLLASETPQSLRSGGVGPDPHRSDADWVVVDAGAHGVEELLFRERCTFCVRHDAAAGTLHLSVSEPGPDGGAALLEAVIQDLQSPLRLLLL